MVAIIDYQAGNIGSIQNMLRRLNMESVITASHQEIENASHIILPGVGAFDYGIQKLRELNLIDVLKRKVLDEKIPTLGICLGAQLMCKTSEEGKLPGLSWVDAVVKKFPTSNNGIRYAVPHMGWDFVKPNKPSKILEGLPNPSRFYFVHSYYIQCLQDSDRLLSNEYGIRFDSAFERDNILGVQFHPEKSHNFGKKLFRNFIERK